MNQEYKALAQIFQMVTLDGEQLIYEQHRAIRQLFRESRRCPWAEWNMAAMLEWLGRQMQAGPSSTALLTSCGSSAPAAGTALVRPE